MPRSAWNGTPHSVLYEPAGSATVHVSDAPGPSNAPDFEPATAKLCTSLPRFVITNVTWPDGIVVCDISNRYSNMLTCTVVCAPPTVPVGGGWVVVVVVVVFVVVVGFGGATPTANTPFMPALA